MALTYGTFVIPSDQYTVIEGGTVAVTVAFESSVGLIGGMDTANGSASTGSVVEVDSPSDAQTLFGDGSELHEQVTMAFNQGVQTVYALPVAETQTTEAFSSTQSGTLSNTPVFDPNIHDEHDITAQDTSASVSVTVNIVYESGTPTAPSSSNTINLNPITGEFNADASSSYDITYTYGDYSATVLDKMAAESPRIVGLCNEGESVINDLDTELTDRATNFNFMHSVAGAHPFVSTSSPDTSGYTDSIDSERVSLVAPSRGYVDDAETNQQRTVGAVAGYLAQLPLGFSSTNDDIDGLTGLRTDLTPSGAGDLIDAQVMPLIDYPPVTIVKDMTTSTTTKFERVYVMQVVDEATELSHQISREFIGDQNTVSTRAQLRRSHRNAYLDMRDGVPKMLDDFDVKVQQDSTDSNKVNLDIGLDVVDVMDTIDVTITVGDIVRSNTVA